MEVLKKVRRRVVNKINLPKYLKERGVYINKQKGKIIVPSNYGKDSEQVEEEN